MTVNYNYTNIKDIRDEVVSLKNQYIKYPDARTYWGYHLILSHHNAINFLLDKLENNSLDSETVIHQVIDKTKDEFLTIAEFIELYPICSCEHLAHLLDKDIGMEKFCTRPRTGKLWFVRPKRTLIYLSQIEHNGSVKKNAIECLKKSLTKEEYDRDFKGCSSQGEEAGTST